MVQRKICFLKSLKGFSKEDLLFNIFTGILKGEDLLFKIFTGILKGEDLLFKIFAGYKGRSAFQNLCRQRQRTCNNFFASRVVAEIVASAILPFQKEISFFNVAKVHTGKICVEISTSTIYVREKRKKEQNV